MSNTNAADDTAGLTLPGSIPGIIRECSPVHHLDYGDGVCVGVGSKYADVAFANVEARKTVLLSELSLRLSDATGRAHAAWVVPALAGLSPDDTRTLPDGSHWVDAEALRLMVLHCELAALLADLEAP